MLLFEEGVMGSTAEEEMKGSMGAGSVLWLPSSEVARCYGEGKRVNSGRFRFHGPNKTTRP